jgi:phage terminase large subunit-like protein
VSDIFYDDVRAQRACEVIEQLLVHTKGIYARRPFVLRPWQRQWIEDIFGTVRWDDQFDLYVRAYRLAWLEMARGNGKSELMAAIALILLCADDEEGAEVYGCARDRDQAAHVYNVAKRMVELGPLRKRLKVMDSRRRIIDPKTGSVYQVIASDAAGNLGQNPHGILFDEVISQPNRDLWDALRTGMGKRTQPLMVAATTPGSLASKFAWEEHRFSERVAEDPNLDPTRYVVIRNTPMDDDPWDEANWSHANPALGDFLSTATLRDEAIEAREDPLKENTFRMYRLAQWVRSSQRALSLDVWDEQRGHPVFHDDDACYGGLDLGAVNDMTAFELVFPDGDRDEVDVLGHYWVPRAQVDNDPGGVITRLADSGHVTVTEGDVTDYSVVREAILEAAEKYALVSLTMDYSFQGIQLAQELQAAGINVTRFRPGYKGFAEPMVQFMRRYVERKIHHGADPTLRWMAGNLHVARDRLDHMMPTKDSDEAKVDGIVALIMAIGEMVADADTRRSAYEDHGLEMA